MNTKEVTTGSGNIPHFMADISPIWIYMGSFMATINKLYEMPA
jgi:hypothetical protein